MLNAAEADVISLGICKRWAVGIASDSSRTIFKCGIVNCCYISSDCNCRQSCAVKEGSIRNFRNFIGNHYVCELIAAPEHEAAELFDIFAEADTCERRILECIIAYFLNTIRNNDSLYSRIFKCTAVDKRYF